MDNLVTLAVVGTGQTPAKEIETGTPIDTLSAQLSTDLERKLLLTAGARAVYQQAGKQPEQAPSAPVAANPEGEHRTCSAVELQLLERVLQENTDRLVIESLKLLQKAHKLLPYELLPLALNIAHQSKDYRAEMIPVLGERGRWLSQFNPSWSWVSQFLSDTSSELPTDAETIWQEGTVGQRTEILRRLRAVDPAQAREWLNDVWKKEKAEARNDFLATFKIGLSAEDEPLLEKALGDRGSNVRIVASSLLARLTDSAFSRRMRERADALLRGKKNYKLLVITPKAVDAQWERDGLPTTDQEEKIGERRYKELLLQKLLPLVPPKHWEEQFAATPEELIQVAKNSDWERDLVETWKSAAVRFADKHWAHAILDQMHQKSDTYVERNRVQSLLFLLSQQEAEGIMLRHLYHADGENSDLFQLISELPEPWSEEFSKAYLLKAREFASTTDRKTYTDYRTYTLGIAAYAISPSCFETALEPWELPNNPKEYRSINFWSGEIEKFTQIITTRKNLIEEIQ